MSNNTPPKEPNRDIIFFDPIAYKDGELCVSLTCETEDDLKYISEHHHNEVIAELKAEIERLKKEVLSLKIELGI